MKKRKIVYSGVLFLALLLSGFFLYAGSNGLRNKFCPSRQVNEAVVDCPEPADFNFIPSVVLF
jgi:hypothetical protein